MERDLIEECVYGRVEARFESHMSVSNITPSLDIIESSSSWNAQAINTQQVVSVSNRFNSTRKKQTRIIGYNARSDNFAIYILFIYNIFKSLALTRSSLFFTFSVN